MVADVFTSEKRSKVMSGIRSSGTQPEERLYQAVRTYLGHRWRIDRNRKDLPGKPDVVVPTLRIALFADGCFFHHCPVHGRIPDSRQEYWAPKILRNVERDRATETDLREHGFEVWRIWEHELKTLAAFEETAGRIGDRLAERMAEVRRRSQAPKAFLAPSSVGRPSSQNE
jgi:DNA mismatch endonuclease (patch repair protein)